MRIRALFYRFHQFFAAFFGVIVGIVLINAFPSMELWLKIVAFGGGIVGTVSVGSFFSKMLFYTALHETEEQGIILRVIMFLLVVIFAGGIAYFVTAMIIYRGDIEAIIDSLGSLLGLIGG